MSDAALGRAAAWAGIDLSPAQLEQLTAFAEWLIGEAIPAGALGPAEGPRIFDRHLADSLVFGVGWGAKPPDTLVDVGSGVGLPGIPLAIAYPDTAVTLLDRSQRRRDLADRALRILRLGNAVTAGDDFDTHRGSYGGATFRGSMAPGKAVAVARRLLRPGGIAMIGLHRGPERPDEFVGGEPGEVFELRETPQGILDSPAWHLRMTAA